MLTLNFILINFLFNFQGENTKAMSMKGIGHEGIGLNFNAELLVRLNDYDWMANYIEQGPVEINYYTYAIIICKL